MKIIIASLCALIAQIGWSQTKISVSSGDWNNPQNWSPASVPNPTDDTLIINHEIDFTGFVQVYANHVFIGSDGILSGNETISIDHNLQVDGVLIGDTIVVGGAGGNYFINNGLIEANQFFMTNAMNTNNGFIDILGVFACPEPFVNTTTGIMETFDILTSSDADVENNGVIYVENWTNEGTVLGTGSFCIANCFTNFGDIIGTLDVCDATPNSGLPCDLNFGNIAQTVTMCAAGACSGSAGLLDDGTSIELTIFPNPTNDGLISIETDAVIESIKVIDLTGRVLLEETDNEYHTIDISSLMNGEYMVIIRTEATTISKRVLKSNR